jgi:hypothetical protein
MRVNTDQNETKLLPRNARRWGKRSSIVTALEASRRRIEQFDLSSMFRQTVPAYTGHSLATDDHDRQGTDVWVKRAGLRDLSVDLKARSVDPLIQFGTDDVLLEMVSVADRQVPGWSVDPAKTTDLVFWLFPTGRFIAAPFPLLCMACQRHQTEWSEQYRSVTTFTPQYGGYRSECLVVPTDVLMNAVAGVSRGVVKVATGWNVQ